MKRLACLFFLSMMVPFVGWAWGSGHGTVAKETLRCLTGTWGERLRADKELSNLFVKSAGAPDDMKTKLRDRAEYFDDELLADFPSNTVMYTFHDAPSRCHLLRAIARAMKRGDGKAVAFALACYSHGAADIYAPGHAPLVGLASGIWCSFGAKAFPADCCELESSAEKRALLRRIVDADANALPPPANDSAETFFDDLLFEPTRSVDMSVWEEEHLAGGERSHAALAHEAARGVWTTVRACAMAERWATLEEVPAFDRAGTAKRTAKRVHAYLAARPITADTYVRGVLPKPGHVPETGVVYDPLGRWTRGMMYIVCRPLAVQVAASLAKTRDAGIVDIREILKNGVPAGMKTLVVPGSGIMSYEGFSKEKFLAEVAKFRARGGRLLWIAGAGGQKPPREIFPDTEKLFLANPVRPEWSKANGPVPAEKLPGCKLVLPDGRSFTAVRKPTGVASWDWDQLSLRYILGYLPTGAVSTVEFEETDGTRTTLGYASPRLAYLPAWAIMPYVFTKTVPSVDPLVLSLDEAGEAIMDATLDAPAFEKPTVLPLSKELASCAAAVDGRLAKAAPPAKSLARFLDYKKRGANGEFTDNPDFWARGVDFTCEAIWKTDGGPGNESHMFGATAISPRHVLFSQHCAPKEGVDLTFRGTDGKVVTRKLGPRRGVTGDLFVGVLDEDLPPAVNPAVILSGSAAAQFAQSRGLPVVTLNQNEEAVVADMAGFIRADGKSVETVAVKPADPKRAAFFKPVVAGDSSNPRFLLAGNHAILLCLMWHGDGGSGTFLPLVAPRIRKAMQDLKPGYGLKEFDFSNAAR